MFLFFTTSPPILYSLFFFFYSYAHHRDLHSFPTRRSSDLGAPLAPSGLVQRAVVWLRRWARHHHGILDARDRKSTRLNSSHVAISYAVFCLKKKKKNKYTI